MRRKAELSTSTNKPEQTRDRHGFRGVPPPPTFSLGALADDCLLTEFEVAAVLRVSTNSVEGWRRQPNHALAWEVLPGGFVRYRAGHIRRYLTMGSPRKGRPATRDDIGPGSTSELARLRARVDELENEKLRLQRENLALRNEVEELRQRLANATGKAAPAADDGLNIPESLLRSTGAAHG
jgi:hypothetical protein